MRDRAWNHNTFHHPALLRLVLPGRCLDVGCGDGRFAAELAVRGVAVDAIDVDAEQVAIARRRCAGLPNVSVLHADFLASGLPPDRYDAVTALASLHHMPLRVAAAEAARVLRPGGRLVVLGVLPGAGSSSDLAWSLASTVLNLMLRLLRGREAMTAPAVMPDTSLAAARRALQEVLPGAVIRRRLLWRYTVVWDKPLSG